MTATMRIAEVAVRSGFSPATLRYYEQVDLLPAPPRTATGYRAYDESVLARLAFGRCRPVQARVVSLAPMPAELPPRCHLTAAQDLHGSDWCELGLGAGQGPPGDPG